MLKIIKVSTDVTGQKLENARLVNSLSEAKQLAEEANKAKSDFLSTMSHEIRTPLNGVIGMLDVLEASSLKHDQIEMVELARESSHSLMNIIDDVLDLARIEAGKVESDQSDFSVEDLTFKVLALAEYQARRNNVELMMHVSPDIPSLIQGEANWLRQVLNNLVSNGIKFCSGLEQPGQVMVSVREVSRQDRQITLEFEVEDNGIGMDEGTASRVFGKFEQAEASTARRFGGTGLGLAISRSLVESMGGEIGLNSAPGSGTRFHFSLDFEIIEEDQSQQVLRGLGIEVFGPDISKANIVRDYLTHSGAQVVFNESSADQELVLKLRPDLSVVLCEKIGKDACKDAPGCRRHLAAAPTTLIVGKGYGWNEAEFIAPSVARCSGSLLRAGRLVQAVAAALGMEVKVGPSGDRGPAKSAPKRYDTTANIGSRIRPILIAEDNQINRKVIQRQMEILGIAAHFAQDGREAFKMLQSRQYSLLLTDLDMPQVDGYELCHAVRACEAREGLVALPIIALTANSTPNDLQKCLDVGMNGSLTKPAKLIDIQAMLEKWLKPVDEPAPGNAIDGAQQIDAAGEAVAVFDRAALTELFETEDRGLQLAIINAFLESAAVIVADITIAHKGQDISRVCALAHQLLSSSRSVGGMQIAETAEKIENCKKDNKIQDLVALVATLQANLDDFRTAVAAAHRTSNPVESE